MSRRDGRDSDTRRHRSRFDQEPSPKRSRRDGKPETERTFGDVRSDERDHLSGDQKHRRRLQDAVPLEAPLKEVSKEEVITNKESDKAHSNREGQKYSSDPTEVPRSRSFFQHDERGSAGVAGRSFKHRTSAEGGWQRDPKEQQIGGAKMRDERIRSHARDNDTWRHDKYLETEADPKPPARKRPSFREEKVPNDSGKADKSVVEPVKTTDASEQPGLENGRRDERGGNGSSRHLDRSERPGGNNNIGGEARRGGDFPPRGGRYGGYGSGSGGYTYNHHREREQQLVVGRQGRGYHHVAGGGGGGGGRVEKWKHDLFDEANRSPPPKNEDDAIAKVEALLAS